MKKYQRKMEENIQLKILEYSIEDFGILNLDDLAVQPMDSSVLVNVTSLYTAKFLYNKRSSIIFSIQSIFIVYLCLSSSSSFLKAYYKNGCKLGLQQH